MPLGAVLSLFLKASEFPVLLKIVSSTCEVPQIFSYKLLLYFIMFFLLLDI